MQLDKKLTENYRQDLLAGFAVCPETEKTLYQLHLAWLDEIERGQDDEQDIEKIASLVRQDRRSHGWSYLSGDEGEKVTTSAHLLLSNLESQIIGIMGKDWYYST